MSETTFEHDDRFEARETFGNVRLGALESMYEELFADVIEDGVITPEERAQLDTMATRLGLDRARLRGLEEALAAAYQARHRIVIRDLSDEESPASIAVLSPGASAETLALEARVKFLENRVRELEKALAEADARASIDVEVGEAALAQRPSHRAESEPDLVRYLQRQPRDREALHALFLQSNAAGNVDLAWRAASVLGFLDAASPEEAAFQAAHSPSGLLRPKAALTQDAWQRLLFDGDEDPIVGEIFGTVVSAVLLGRLSALRRDKQLLKLDPALRQEPTKTTLQAVRCFHWAAAILGLEAPPLYADPEFAGSVELVPGMPPASRIGAAALSGRSAAELAFLAGRHLTGHREEHFVRLLVPSLRGLEDIFLAALSLGNPALPMSASVREAVEPIARAMGAVLDPAQVAHLRTLFVRFAEQGGRANLMRWSEGVDRTSARAGLLLANDLKAARSMLALEDASTAEPKMTALLAFFVSDASGELRRELGVALGQEG